MRKQPLFLGLALVAVGALAFVTGHAFAEDEAPMAPATKIEGKTEAKTAEAKPETATPSPMHSIMKWVASQTMPGVECPCPTTEAGEAGWRAWYASDAPALKGLRDALVTDGWNADRMVGFFKQMAAQKSCGGCDKCPSADASGAADASSADGKCCSKKADCGGCDKKVDGSGAADASSADGKCCSKKADGGCCSKKADGSGAADASPSDGKCCGKCKEGNGACPESCPCPNKAAKSAKEPAAPEKSS